jgi:predicted transcriptional regulator
MQRTNIYLDRRLTGILDELADERGVSRAALIRSVLEDAVTATPDKLGDDLAAIEASSGLAPRMAMPDRGETERDRYLEELRSQDVAG